MPTQESSGDIRIGEWTVHPALDSISRGTETQKLEPREMRLLLCLADAAGAVVSVDRLLAQVWPDVVVGSASVYQAVSQLRKILGDVEPSPTYIATVPRKGYRLIAAVQRASAPDPTPQAPVVLRSTAVPRRVWVVAGACVALALAAAYFLADKAWLSKHTTAKPATSVVVSDRSIAVLPFADMSEKKDQEYFADGMAEELINHLTRSPGLKVIARTSSFQFKGRNEDVRSIAGKLGVAHLLEGSVRKVGQELRVTTQLIRASDGMHLWSQTYDRNLADIFKVQDEISERVARALNTTLAITDQPIGHEADVEAYNLVLEGNYYKARRTKGDVEKAIQLYKKAIDLRPNYALPWARLASGYLTVAEAKGTPSPEDNAKILAALGTAIRLDPNLVWAYYTRAGFEIAIKWDWAAAQADHERMRELDPGIFLLPLALGDMALLSGHVDQAVQQYERAIELNPLDPIAMRALGVALCASDRLQDCLQYRLRLQQLHPELRGINAFVGEARLLLGQVPEAFDAVQKEPEQDARLAGLATVFAAMGKHTESDAALKTLEESYAVDDAYEIAQIHAYRGEADASFEWLQRSFRMHNSKILFIKTDPLLRNLRRDPRFQTLLANLRLPE
jgi:TolB-like protein/DNA-binding winged helix-turn-helix (wHTH) protein/predicted Zn-dependent protease